MSQEHAATFVIAVPSNSGRRIIQRIVMAMGAAAVCPSNTAGQSVWKGTWNWRTQVAGPGAPVCDLIEFAHAALIPTGLHRGKVLLWHLNDNWCGPSGVFVHESWLFDPASPIDLIRVTQTLSTNLFCSGHTFDPDGALVAAGGVTFQPGALAGFRFAPSALGSVTIVGGYPEIAANPWRSLGDMSSKHWYPTLLTLMKEALPVNSSQSACGTFATLPGGSTVVAGGAYVQNPGDTANHMRGTEVWERLPRGAGNTFTCPVVPVDMSASAPNWPGAAHEKYSRKPDSNPADPNLTSYPRMFQLSFANAMQAFVANDTHSDASDPNASPANLAWAMKLPYASVLAQNPGYPDHWQLWRALDSASSLNNDRYYGNAVYFSTLDAFGLRLNDRVIVLGGARHNGTTWVVNSTIQEFIPTGLGPNFAAQGGEWRTKLTLNSPVNSQDPAAARYFANAVVLPTGEILVIGGANSFGAGQSVRQPALYDPGRARSDPGVWIVENTDPGTTGTHAPRLYHNLAVLLPDGQVLQAGGDDVPGLPDSEYSGEIYMPEYLSYGFRPAILSTPDQLTFEPINGTAEFEITLTKKPDSIIDRVVLLRPASVTHFFDPDQRYIELQVTTPTGEHAGEEISIKVRRPTEDLGPPGWYMLFVIEKDTANKRVPSVAHFIKFV